MPSIADRVRETTTTTGTGTVNLEGAVTGFQLFSAAFSTGTVVYYCISDGTNWEIGYGAVTTGSPWTLARTTVLRSTNADALVDFAAGSKDVFCTMPAQAFIAANITNTPAGNIAATTVQAAINELDSEKQAVAAKDATGGYAGLTLFSINFKNAANTFTNLLTNATTAARTYTFQDRSGTIADNTDLALKANIASPVFTGNVTGLGVSTGTSFNAITALSSTTPVVAGTAAIGVGTTAARGDHVHPAQTTVTGNAGTVTNGVYTTNKDASGGVPGLTLFKLNLRNSANTITSWFTTAATVARTWTMPDKDGTVAMTSDLVGKQTIWLPAGAMTSRTSSGAAAGSVETTTNKIMLKSLDFDTATSEYAQFAIQMPKSWNEGTVTARFVWSHAATTTNFGVAWALQGVALSDDDAADAAFGTAVLVTDTGGTTNDIYVSADTAAVTIAGTPAAQDWVVFQVYRAVADAGDTMAVDARLHGVQLFYTTDAANDA